MRTWKLAAFIAAACLWTGTSVADMQGTGESGGWAKRIAVVPDPSKVVVPDGYEVGVLVSGLDTPSAATVDGEGNVWVAISGPLFGGLDEIEPPHVKVFDPAGNLLKEIGKGVFTTVMNEIGYCAENDTVYIPEYGEKIFSIQGVDGELQVVVRPHDRGPPERRRDLQGRLPLFRTRSSEQHRIRRSRQPWLG